MFITDSGMWEALSSFAHKLGVPEDFISKAKRDFKNLLSRYADVRRTVNRNCSPEELDSSLSMQNFYPWFENLFCFYLLILAGFRHTALRELRFYLESSARCYYIDSKHNKKGYEEKMKILKNLRWKRFKELLQDLPSEKRKELGDFYNELCNYVHLSEESQTDALRDFGLNLALRHPYYEQDKEMLEKTFAYANFLLLKSFI